MATLKLSKNYLNPYEAAHDTYKGSPAYQAIGDSTWQTYAREGNLDTLVSVLYDVANSDTGFTGIKKEYNDNFDYLDSESKVAAIANSLYEDRDTLETYYKYTSADGSDSFYSDDKTLLNYDTYANYSMEEVQISAYDYTQSQINRYADYQKEQYDLQIAQAEKDNMNGFAKFMASVAAIPMRLISSAFGMIQNIGIGLWGLANVVADVASGKDSDEAWDEFRSLFEGNTLLEDSLIEFESKYTYYRDISGNTTTVGNYVISLADTFGMVLPTVLLSKVPVVGKSSNFMYWFGMGTNNFREYVNDESMASVPTSQLIIASGAKAALEYAVMKGLNKALGGASLADKFVFGYSTNWTAKGIASVGKKLLADAVHEGLEEVLQQMSNVFVDSIMSYFNSSFSAYATVSMQELADAFILGAVGSLIGGSMSLITTKRISTNTPKTDKAGNIVYDADGNVVYEKFGKWKSIVTRNGIEEMFKIYEEIKSNNDLTAEQSQQLENQLMLNYAIASQIYGEMGSERFQNANTLLNQLLQELKSRNYDHNALKSYADALINQYNVTIEDYYSGDTGSTSITSSSREDKRNKAKSQDKAAEKIAEAKVGNVEQQVTRDDLTEISEESKSDMEARLKRIMDSDPDINQVLVVDKSEKPVQVGDTVIVSKAQLNILGDAGIQKSLAEQKLVENVSKMSMYNTAFKELKTLWNKLYQKRQIENTEDIIYQVFFNDDFFKIALQYSNVQTSKVLTALMDLEAAAVGNTIADSIYKHRMETIFANRSKLLIQYYISQLNDTSYKTNGLFDSKTVAEIDRKRYSKDLYNRVVKGDKLTQEEIGVLNERINFLPISDANKTKLRSDLSSKNPEVRRGAMNALNSAYKDIFTGPYNGSTYLTADGLGNMSWNTWAEKTGVTIKTLAAPITDPKIAEAINSLYGDTTTESIIKYHQKSFADFTDNTYSFTYSNGKVTVQENMDNPETIAYTKLSDTDYNRGHYGKDQFIVTSAIAPKSLQQKYVNTNMDYHERVTFDDMIKDTSTLSKATKDAIITKYGRLNSRNTFLYLRDELAKEGFTLSVSKNGQFEVGDIRNALTLLKSKDGWKKTDKDGKTTYIDVNKEYSIQEFIKPTARDAGILKEVKVRFTTEEEVTKKKMGPHYDPTSNTIVLDRNAIRNASYMNASFLHEYQHAIQWANNWNGGISSTWVTDYAVSDGVLSKMLKDLEEHMPQLFHGVKGKASKLGVLQQFVYETSGESQALSLEHTERNTFFPTIVNMTQQNGYITMPWGTTYRIYRGDSILSTNYWSLRKGSDVVNFVKDILDPKYYAEYYNISRAFDVTDKDRATLKNILAGANEVTMDFTYGSLASDSTITSQQYHKQQYERSITPERKNEILKVMHDQLAKNVPFDTFVNMDIPLARFQYGNDFMYDEMASFSAGDTALNLLKGDMWRSNLLGDKIAYVFVGTFKPKDIVSYMDNAANEVLIEPSKISHFKQYAMTSTDALQAKSASELGLRVLSTSTVDIREKTTRYFTQNVPQDQGAIKVVGTLPKYSATITKNIKRAFAYERNVSETTEISSYRQLIILPIKDGIFASNRDWSVVDNNLEIARNDIFKNDLSVNLFATEFESFTNSISTIEYDEDLNIYVIRLGEIISSDYINTITELLRKSIGDNVQFPLTVYFDTHNFKISGEHTIESESDLGTFNQAITGYIDEVNKYVATTKEQSLQDELETMQPSQQSTVPEHIKGQGVYNLYNDKDIAAFKKGMQNINERINSDDATKYKQIIEDNKDATDTDAQENAYSASTRWLKSVLQLTDNDYVPVMLFEAANESYLGIPVDAHPTYDFKGDYTLQTGLLKVSDIDAVDTEISNGFIEVSDINSVNMQNTSPVHDIEIDADKGGFTITNPESEIVYNKQSFAKPKDKVTFTERWKAKRDLRGKNRDKARYISNKDAQGTVFQNFIKRNKRIQMDPALQDLLAEFDKDGNLEQVDKGLRKYIDGLQKGTLTIPVLYEYIRKAKSMNDYTFQAIAEHIFLNPNIKNFKQLKAYADISAADYFAVRTVLRNFNRESWLDKKMNYGKVTQLIDTIKSKPDWAALYEKIYNMYYLYRGAYSVDVDSADMRILFMKYFEGDIDSAADIASLARWKAIHNFNTAGNIATISMETSIGEDIKLEDTIADTASSEFISTIGGYVTEQEMMDAIKDHRFSKLYSDGKYLEMTDAELKAAEQQITEEVDDMTSEEIVKAYTTLQVAEESFMDDYYKAVDEAIAKEIEPERNLRDAIKRIANGTIKKHLSKDAMKRFLEENPDFYNENGRFNENLLKGMSYNDIVNFHAQVLELSRMAQRGAFNSKFARSLYNKTVKQAKQIAKLKQEKAALEDALFKYENTETKKFADGIEFTINSDIPMPGRLGEMIKNAINAGVSTATESQVKFVTEADTQNATVSMKKFVEANSEILGTLTQGEADDIIEFYANSMALQTDPTVSRNYYRAYQAYEIVVLTYLEVANRNSIISLTNEQLDTINNILNTMVSTATTIATTWRDAMKALNPTKVIVQSLRQSSGLEISEADVNSLVGALNLSIGDDIVVPGKDGSESTIVVTEEYKLNAINKAMHDIEEHVLEQYRQRQKHRTKADAIFGKLHAFRKMMMLSSPGTAIRNLSSNVIVYNANKAGGRIGDFAVKVLQKTPGISKFFKKDTSITGKQWQISGTKVDQDTKEFVDNFFNRSIYETTDSKGKVKKVTFYDAVADGLTKYDPRRQKRAIKEFDPTTQTGVSFTETMAENMIQSVVNKVYQQHKFDSQMDSKFKKVNSIAEKAGKGLNKVSNMVYWLLQDDPFIKKMTKYYFERMLVEDNVPLSQGLSSRTFDLFAEAYTKAAYDFMHKPNVFNKIEQYIHQKMGAGAHFMYTTLFPFASASWNWFIEGLNYTPIGLLKGVIQYAKLENTVQKMEKQIQAGDLTYSPKFASYEARKTIGKGVIGSIGTLIGILLGCAGLAGIDDEDGTLKLYIGDTYIDISSLFGSQGILVGLLMTSAKYDEDMTFSEGLMAVLDALFDDSVFNDLYNSFRYADSVSDWLLSNVEDAVGQFIPNFVKTFNSMLYTHQVKYSSGIRGTFEYWGVSLIPGLAYALPKVYDVYTGEVQSKYKLQWLVNFINKMSPIDIAPYNISDLEKEAIANGVSKSQLTGNYTDIGQLSAEQVSLLNQYYGTLNKSDLENFINNKSSYSVQNDDGTYSTLKYSQMTADQRKRVIERIMSNNATYAKIYIYTQIMGGKYYASDSTYTALKALGITKNVYKETTKLSGFN